MIDNDTFYDFLSIYIFSGIITLTVMIGNLFALIFTSAGILHLVSQGQNMLSAAVSIEASEWLSTAAYKTSYCCCICLACEKAVVFWFCCTAPSPVTPTYSTMNSHLREKAIETPVSVYEAL